MKINPINMQNVENSFKTFSENIIKTPAMSSDLFIASIKTKEQELSKAGMLSKLSDKFYDLAQTLFANGKMGLATIVCSRLIKFPNITLEQKEKYIKTGLEFSEMQGDKMHVLARLEDLHQLYDEKGCDTQKVLKVMIKEERVLKDIVADFDGAVENFKTPYSKEKDVKNYEDLLATLQVDIAKILERRKPKKAEQRLRDAMQTFKKLGDEEIYRFADKIMTRIEIQCRK